MNKVFHWFMLLAVYVFALAAPGLSYAAPSVGSSSAWSSTKMINDIIRNTPGVRTYTPSGTGVRVGGMGTAHVGLRPGLSIPVPASAYADVSVGRMAGMAARAMRYGSYVGIATLVVPWIADQYGIKVCPPPDFFCKPGPDVPFDPVTGGWRVQNPADSKYYYAGTGQAACNKLYSVMSASQQGVHGELTFERKTANPHRCIGSKSGSTFNNYWFDPVCPAGSIKTANGDCVQKGPDIPATESDLGGAIESAATNNPPRVGNLFGAVEATGMPMFDPNDTVTVTAPPVVVPTRTTTTTSPNPDGSTDTVTTKTDTVITPSVQGNTVNNTNITYPSTTTTTTTTTNNVTNITNVTTTVTNSTPLPVPVPDGSAPPPPVVPYPTGPQTETEAPEIPTDYNREVTQKSILDTLREMAGPVDAPAPTGDDQLASQQSKIAEGVTAVAGVTEEATGLKGWMPSITSTSCVNPQVPNPMTGVMKEVVICDAVEIFAKFFGAVISVFALYGSIREVQSALKA